MLRRRFFRTLLLLCLGASLACRHVPKPDLIIHHGKILTVDSNFGAVDAMVIQGDRILATGSNDRILALAGPKTRQIDLHGKTVLPGLIDSHLHAVNSAMYEFDHPVPDMETLGDVLKYIQARAAALPKGEWVTLSQVFITRLRDQRYPTRQELDKAAPNNPVFFRTGPDAVLNSLALKLNGIDKNYVVPEATHGPRSPRAFCATAWSSTSRRRSSPRGKITSNARECYWPTTTR
jgi:hypothetical protein